MHTDDRDSRFPLRRWSRRCASLVVVALCAAQTSTQAPVPKPVVSWPWELRFADIATALVGLDFEATQARRALDRNGQPIGLIEHLSHGHAADGTERFELTLVGIEGRSIAPGELQRRQSEYGRYQAALYYYQGFQLRDPVRAAENYSLLYLGEASRAGRAAFRVAVVPNAGDRSLWILDIDWRTGFPLYRCEYDPAGTMVGELEVTSFRVATAGNPVTGTWWAPRMGVVEHADPRACLATLDSEETIVPAATWLPPGYRFHEARTVTNLFNGERTAVLEYTDGIDQVVVLQALLDDPVTLRPGDNFLRFEEAGMAQLSFTQDRLRVLVVGRKSLLPALRNLTLALYRQTIR